MCVCVFFQVTTLYLVQVSGLLSVWLLQFCNSMLLGSLVLSFIVAALFIRHCQVSVCACLCMNLNKPNRTEHWMYKSLSDRRQSLYGGLMVDKRLLRQSRISRWHGSFLQMKITVFVRDTMFCQALMKLSETRSYQVSHYRNIKCDMKVGWWARERRVEDQEWDRASLCMKWFMHITAFQDCCVFHLKRL